MHGPRAFEMVAALAYRWPQVQSGIVYIGDSCIDAGREHCCGSCRKQGRASCSHEHCCMARLMRRCGKTAQRAKHDLQRVGLVKLHGAGPGVHAGGKFTGPEGPTAAATGYELEAAIFAAPRPPRAPRPASDYVSPAVARVRAQGQAKMRQALESMRERASP